MRFSRYDHNFTAYTLIQDANGYQTGKTTLYASFDADIQPVSRSASRSYEFGANVASLGMRALYHDNEYPLPLGTIVKDNADGYYRVVDSSPWNGHIESILEPFNGTI